ncbi:MAG: 2-oxo acid dehydrogenase subunit E2 [Acidobacteria bacterium]|nr:2-oxo acid dehydrogenase subunit E2 [Acidobacteriota bacterium]
MLKDLKLPELGENIETAVVSAVLVSPGDAVKKEQPILEVETDKATAEVPSTVEGVVKEIRVKVGDEIKVGHILLTLEEDSQQAPGPSAATPPPKAQQQEDAATETAPPAPSPPEAVEPQPAAPVAPRTPAPDLTANPAASRSPADGSSTPAAPAVRLRARELGIDISQVAGTGTGARITMEDVTEHARMLISSQGWPAPEAARANAAEAVDLPDFSQWGSIRREPMSGVRRKTAEHLSKAWAQIPHVTQFDQADITRMEALRKRWTPKAEAAGGKLTVTAIILKVVAASLKVFPRFNASLDLAHREIILKDFIHIGVAVDAGHGLLTPVIRNADQKNILQLAAELTDLSQRARSKKLTNDEMRGSSFTVSNLGGLGTTYFSPIINYPEVALLGVGRATQQAIYQDGSFEPRLILPLSISYDHRLIDGADAARFLRWIAEALEEPLKIALEG